MANSSRSVILTFTSTELDELDRAASTVFLPRATYCRIAASHPHSSDLIPQFRIVNNDQTESTIRWNALARFRQHIAGLGIRTQLKNVIVQQFDQLFEAIDPHELER